jgi:hypothetical protein
MPSPFPGFDPYLEIPSYWSDVHRSFLVGCRVRLNRTLSVGYAARIAEHICDETSQPCIEIIALEPQQHVVTVLELLSPGNKAPGVGHEEYVRKRGQLLRSDIHLLEIDLLRSGLHTVGVPQAQGPGREYLVSLHRGDGSWRFETWAFGVRDRLPRVAVPLADTLPDVPLDLQVVLNDVYDGGRYGDTLDYARDPVPPLETNDATWADALLRQAGRRP